MSYFLQSKSNVVEYILLTELLDYLITVTYFAAITVPGRAGF